jgi:carbonic anhydrase
MFDRPRRAAYDARMLEENSVIRMRPFALLLAALLSGCAALPPGGDATAVMTRETQARLTPDAALELLKQGNLRFTSGRMAQRDLRRQVKATGEAQYPLASIVTCIDSRAGPELVFDQGIGDVFSVRVAGYFINEDMLGSLEFASKVAGARLIVVLGHTSCGAIKGACDNVAMGNLTGMLAKIQPAVQSVSYAGERSGKNAEFVELVAQANVRRTVQEILQRSPILRELVERGELKVVGAMLDVSTGAVIFY